ncbi:MAG: FliI/YscN family ATPase [Deltaproteobacteria bacterium]|nr:FliI/YscN family ATPase [Deltaproteobacteria bacterium]
MLLLNELTHCSRSLPSPLTYSGRVAAVRGPLIAAKLPAASLGELCEIELAGGSSILSQLVSFDENYVYLAPFDHFTGLAPGNRVRSLKKRPSITFNPATRGAALDVAGRLLGNSGSSLMDPPVQVEMELHRPAPCALSRKPVAARLITGVRGIDALCPIGYGQRIALMAGAGAGKSTLLSTIARNAEVDVTVIALVGERGREVNEFIENGLGQLGMQRSVLVVATSDQSAIKRSMAAAAATAIAEHYRSVGKRVLLLVDSLTRTARAIREVGLASGELPVRQGLTPSVYSELPRLLERAGNDHCGSITAIYTLLDSSEQEPDALGEEVKSLLDGHISLSGKIAMNGIRPSIDYRRSVSRVADQILTRQQQQDAASILKMINRLAADRDVVLLGGSPDKELQACLDLEPQLVEFLNQSVHCISAGPETSERARKLSELFHNATARNDAANRDS